MILFKNSIDKEITMVMEDLDGRAETYLSIEPDYNHSPCFDDATNQATEWTEND